MEHIFKAYVFWGKSLKVLLKIINIDLTLTLESSFACSWSQKGSYVPNWWVFSSFLTITNISNG